MNHDSAAPPIPRLNRSLMSFSCCTLSKAFDISSIATAVYFFLILLAASDLSALGGGGGEGLLSPELNSYDLCSSRRPLASLLTLSFFVLSRQCLKMRVLGVDVET